MKKYCALCGAEFETNKHRVKYCPGNVHGGNTQLSTIINYMIPEQFTGLHDKNGREVYEGDVLLCESNFNGFYVCVINYNEKEARYALTKYGGSKDRDYRDSNIHGCYPFGFSGSSINCPSRIEIIGNIHENSELLNPTKDGLCNKQP